MKAWRKVNWIEALGLWEKGKKVKDYQNTAWQLNENEGALTIVSKDLKNKWLVEEEVRTECQRCIFWKEDNCSKKMWWWGLPNDEKCFKAEYIRKIAYGCAGIKIILSIPYQTSDGVYAKDHEAVRIWELFDGLKDKAGKWIKPQKLLEKDINEDLEITLEGIGSGKARLVEYTKDDLGFKEE